MTFLKPINIPKDLIENDGVVNLDKNSYIIQNEMYINETELPNFNKRALIEFYDIPFIEPKILKNEDNCPGTECRMLSYTNNTLKIEILSFSKYSIVEGYSPPSSSGSSSGESARKKNENEII
jgi:hypothetical protein